MQIDILSGVQIILISLATFAVMMSILWVFAKYVLHWYFDLSKEERAASKAQRKKRKATR